MPIGDSLKSFRKGGYGAGKQDDGGEDKTSSSGPRSFKLTDEEAKELQGYSKGPGMEQECTVTGRLGENGEFTVSSVHAPGNGESEEMGQAMAGPQGGPPMMQMPMR